MTDLDKKLRALEKACHFDPAFLCIFCEQPVNHLSTGGPMVCPSCDCGYNRDGTPWTHQQAIQRYANARKRLAQPIPKTAE